MPHPHESATGPVTELPKPELNPMLNPTLGRNLGRWAHVYFTSPPEKREQAVLELLRELEAESGAPESAMPLNGTSTSPATEGHVTPETVLCIECGHQNAKAQRFCGMCGASLTLDDATSRVGSREVMASTVNKPSPKEPEPAPVHQPVFPTLSLFAQVGEETSSSTTRNSGIHWLRDRDFEEENATSPALKYVLVVLAILLAGAFFYNRSRTQVTRGPGEQGPSGLWTGSAPPPVRTPSSSPAPATAEDANSKKLESAPPATSIPNHATPKEPTPAEPNVRSAPETTRPTPAANADTTQATTTPASKSPQPTATPPESEAKTNSPEWEAKTNGSEELALAEAYLTGKRGPRNSAVAATFLWKAVSKENTTATLMLSDLYRTGDGVPQSCDQARLLLYAAARKNVPEAGRKLRDLQAGCP